MLKIPYGKSDYRKIKEEGYYYVDKTMYLEKLENIADTVVYLRPGRFGKTLFTSMMYYYYDVNSKDNFKKLFGDTYVGKNPTKNKNNYYVLKLDFSNITGNNMNEKELEIEFKNKIISGIKKFSEYYQFDITVSFQNSPNGMLLEFLDAFYSLSLEHKLYIIIDEYDNFTNAILEGNGDKFKGILGNSGFVKSFYAVIKEYVGLGVVDRVFITGVCPITLDSMTTGFNIAKDISRDLEFHSMIGLTHEEVKELIQDIDKDRQEEIYQLMVNNYDGYLFHKDSPSRTFNATLVMYFLSEYYRNDMLPDKLMDVNIVFNYGKVEDLIKLQGNMYYQEILNSLFRNDSIMGSIKEKFNLEYDFTKDDIISLLYYFGYLTIDKATFGGIEFKIPNYIMKETYTNYFLKILNEAHIYLDSNMKNEYLKEMVLEGRIEKITNYVSEILKYADQRTFIQFDEKYIQLLYFSMVMDSRDLKIYSEYQVKNGYADLMILRNSPLSQFDMMIELKYLKVREYRKNKKLLEEKRQEAIHQLEKYQDDERLDVSKLKRYIVIFVGNNVKVLEELM